MKRIKYACLEKTLHFQLKEDLDRIAAIRAVQDEVAHYKDTLERNQTKYRILEETAQPDGSVILKLKMQYNHSPVGDYLDG